MHWLFIFDLEQTLEAAEDVKENEAKAQFYKENILTSMKELRKSADLAENPSLDFDFLFPHYSTYKLYLHKVL